MIEFAGVCVKFWFCHHWLTTIISVVFGFLLFLCVLYLLIFQNSVWCLEAGAGEEKDNLWRAAQEEVWNARRLWMGRRIMGMVQRRLFLLVAWRLGLLPLSLTQNAILLLFLGGSRNLILALVSFIYFLSFSSSSFLFSCYLFGDILV